MRVASFPPCPPFALDEHADELLVAKRKQHMKQADKVGVLTPRFSVDTIVRLRLDRGAFGIKSNVSPFAEGLYRIHSIKDVGTEIRYQLASVENPDQILRGTFKEDDLQLALDVEQP